MKKDKFYIMTGNIYNGDQCVQIVEGYKDEQYNVGYAKDYNDEHIGWIATDLLTGTRLTKDKEGFKTKKQCYEDFLKNGLTLLKRFQENNETIKFHHLDPVTSKPVEEIYTYNELKDTFNQMIREY